MNVTPIGSHPKIDALDGFDAPIPARNPINDGGVAWTGRTGGVPVNGSHFPKRVRSAHSQQQLPAYFESLREITVSERAKSAIEDVEGRVHQFSPVNFMDSKGKKVERPWYQAE